MGAALLLTAAEAGSAKAAELDGELLTCCAEADAANTACRAIDDEIGDFVLADPRWQAGFDRSVPLAAAYGAGVRRAAKLPARTPEGLLAKASLALRSLEPAQDDYPLVASVLRDVIGRTGA